MREKLTKRNEQTGFTIIEVVLVLAIAGLIFLIVFLALPQLQRSRRDTQRKNDVGRLMAALETYAGNFNGDYPTTQGQIDGNFDSYRPGNFEDPSDGNPYTITVGGQTEVDAFDDSNVGLVIFSANESCNGDTFSGSGGGREVAAVMNLEQGQYCQDNQ